MRRFELLEPSSIQEACEILSGSEDAKPIAGGTALLILIKQGLYVPSTLINLKKTPGTTGIGYDPRTGLRIGALTSIHDVENDPSVRQHYPALARACHLVANIRIRNMATIGGNLAHADYQSDPPTVLMTLGASVEMTAVRGPRELKLADFLLGPYETALMPGEILSAVLVPPPPERMTGTYIKFTTGSSEERPCAGVSAMARVRNGVCEEARLAVGAVSPTPIRVHAAENLAAGERFTAELIERMAVEAARAIDPIGDHHGSADYKRHLVRVLSRRALQACTTQEETTG